MLSFMPDQFISNRIVIRIVIIDQNYSKYKEYKLNLEINNNKNNFHNAIKSANGNNSGNFGSCIHINMNEFEKNLFLMLISAIYNLFTDYLAQENADQSL